MSPRTAQLSLALPARLFQSSHSPLNPYVTFNGQKSFALRTIENRERDRFDETNRQHFLPNNTRPAEKKRNSLEKKLIRLKFDCSIGVGRSNFKIGPSTPIIEPDHVKKHTTGGKAASSKNNRQGHPVSLPKMSQAKPQQVKIPARSCCPDCLSQMGNVTLLFHDRKAVFEIDCDRLQ